MHAHMTQDGMYTVTMTTMVPNTFFVLSRLLSSLWLSRTGSASDWCALQEALYNCIDTIQYNTGLSRHHVMYMYDIPINLLMTCISISDCGLVLLQHHSSRGKIWPPPSSNLAIDFGPHQRRNKPEILGKILKWPVQPNVWIRHCRHFIFILQLKYSGINQ